MIKIEIRQITVFLCFFCTKGLPFALHCLLKIQHLHLDEFVQMLLSKFQIEKHFEQLTSGDVAGIPVK